MDPFVPLELRVTIEEAHSMMLQHPQHQLLPVWRQEIYKTLGQGEALRINPVRGWLALVSAEYVHRNGNPNNPKGFSDKRLLMLARDTLRGLTTVAVALHTAEQAWIQLEQLGNSQDAAYQPTIFYAWTAAAQALFEITGVRSFDELTLTEEDTDDWLDPWSSDTAKWAAYSYAGRGQSSASANAKSKEFWEWWLLVAIPKAWQLAQQT